MLPTCRIRRRSIRARRRVRVRVRPGLATASDILAWSWRILRPFLLASQQVRQMRNERNVCGRHRVVLQAGGPDPREGLAFLRRRETLPSPAYKQRHQEMKVWISVTRKSQRGETRFFYDNSQFLLEFPDEGRLGRLARFDLATREFP